MKRLVFLLAIVTGIVLLVRAYIETPTQTPRHQTVASADASTPTPYVFHALTTESEAIARGDGLYPGNPPTGIARLVTRLDAVSWRDRATPDPSDYDAMRLAKPAWVVAYPGGGLTACDIVPLNLTVGGLGAACDSSTVLYGVYFILDAENGVPITIGELTADKVTSLRALSNGTFSITATTPEPLEGATVAAPLASPPSIITSTPIP